MALEELRVPNERALAAREEQLEAYVDRCEAVLRELRRGVVLDADGRTVSPDAAGAIISVARDLLESRSRLAQVRRNLRRLRAR